MSVRARRESSGEPSSILKYHSAPDVCCLVAVTPTSPRSHSLLIDSALWVSDYLPDSTYNLTFILLFVYYDRFNPPRVRPSLLLSVSLPFPVPLYSYAWQF